MRTGLPHHPARWGTVVVVIAISLAAGVSGGAVVGALDWLLTLPADDSTWVPQSPRLVLHGLCSTALISAALALVALRLRPANWRIVTFGSSIVGGFANPALALTLGEFGGVPTSFAEVAAVSIVASPLSLLLGAVFGGAFLIPLASARALGESAAIVHLEQVLLRSTALLGASVLIAYGLGNLSELRPATLAETVLGFSFAATAACLGLLRRHWRGRMRPPDYETVPLDQVIVQPGTPSLLDTPPTQAVVAHNGSAYRERPTALFLL